MRTMMGERGQMVIPKRLRDSLGLRSGQPMEVHEEEGRLIVTKVIDDDPIARVYGTLKLPEGMDTDALMDLLRGPADLPPEPPAAR